MLGRASSQWILNDAQELVSGEASKRAPGQIVASEWLASRMIGAQSPHSAYALCYKYRTHVAVTWELQCQLGLSWLSIRYLV